MSTVLLCNGFLAYTDRCGIGEAEACLAESTTREKKFTFVFAEKR